MPLRITPPEASPYIASGLSSFAVPGVRGEACFVVICVSLRSSAGLDIGRVVAARGCAGGGVSVPACRACATLPPGAVVWRPFFALAGRPAPLTSAGLRRPPFVSRSYAFCDLARSFARSCPSRRFALSIIFYSSALTFGSSDQRVAALTSCGALELVTPAFFFHSSVSACSRALAASARASAMATGDG